MLVLQRCFWIQMSTQACSGTACVYWIGVLARVPCVCLYMGALAWRNCVLSDNKLGLQRFLRLQVMNLWRSLQILAARREERKRDIRTVTCWVSSLRAITATLNETFTRRAIDYNSFSNHIPQPILINLILFYSCYKSGVVENVPRHHVTSGLDQISEGKNIEKKVDYWNMRSKEGQV